MSCKECDGCGYCYEKAAAQQVKMLEEEQDWKEQEWDNFCKRHQLPFDALHKANHEFTMIQMEEDIVQESQQHPDSLEG